jgi:D-ribulokinase
VVAPDAEEPVLLGSAILASVAAGVYPDVRQAMEALSRTAAVYAPDGQNVAAIHERRYQAFLNLQQLTRTLRSL